MLQFGNVSASRAHVPDAVDATRQTSRMADFHVYRDRVEIRLSRAEKVLALRRDDIVVPRDSIRSVAITSDPWIWIRGVRSPGNMIPLTLAVGTWKFHGGKDFLVLKGKQRSAVVIDIERPDDEGRGEQEADDAPARAEVADGFSRIIVSTQHASQLVEALRDIRPDGDGPVDEVIS